jgi:hypothetical protein
MSALIEQIQQQGAASDADVDFDSAAERSPLLEVESLMTYGKIIGETNDAIIDEQTLPDTEPPVVAQYTLMGIPMNYFHDIFSNDIVAVFKEMGIHCSAQPNSVALTASGVDKATCVRWLADQSNSGALGGKTLDLRHAIAFGDIPSTIDRPLTALPPMAFVSVSMDSAADPPGVLHVGGEEAGTALFLENLSALLHSCNDPDEVFDRRHLDLIAAQCRGKIYGQAGSTTDQRSGKGSGC